MSIELKIKIINLMDEARTIRKEEQKLHGMEKWHLQQHRKTVVRDAARRSQIAYHICRGSEHGWRDPASHREAVCWADWPHVEKMVRKYGSQEVIENLKTVEKKFKGVFLEKPVETRASLQAVSN